MGCAGSCCCYTHPKTDTKQEKIELLIEDPKIENDEKDEKQIQEKTEEEHEIVEQTQHDGYTQIKSPCKSEDYMRLELKLSFANQLLENILSPKSIHWVLFDAKNDEGDQKPVHVIPFNFKFHAIGLDVQNASREQYKENYKSFITMISPKDVTLEKVKKEGIEISEEFVHGEEIFELSDHMMVETIHGLSENGNELKEFEVIFKSEFSQISTSTFNGSLAQALLKSVNWTIEIWKSSTHALLARGPLKEQNWNSINLKPSLVTIELDLTFAEEDISNCNQTFYCFSLLENDEDKRIGKPFTLKDGLSIQVEKEKINDVKIFVSHLPSLKTEELELGAITKAELLETKDPKRMKASINLHEAYGMFKSSKYTKWNGQDLKDNYKIIATDGEVELSSKADDYEVKMLLPEGDSCWNLIYISDSYICLNCIQNMSIIAGESTNEDENSEFNTNILKIQMDKGNVDVSRFKQLAIHLILNTENQQRIIQTLPFMESAEFHILPSCSYNVIVSYHIDGNIEDVPNFGELMEFKWTDEEDEVKGITLQYPDDICFLHLKDLKFNFMPTGVILHAMKLNQDYVIKIRVEEELIIPLTSGQWEFEIYNLNDQLLVKRNEILENGTYKLFEDILGPLKKEVAEEVIIETINERNKDEVDKEEIVDECNKEEDVKEEIENNEYNKKDNEDVAKGLL